MPEPTRPALMSEVTSGASARTMAMDTSEGSHEVAPNSISDGRDCLVNTMPVTVSYTHLDVYKRQFIQLLVGQ